MVHGTSHHVYHLPGLELQKCCLCPGSQVAAQPCSPASTSRCCHCCRAGCKASSFCVLTAYTQVLGKHGSTSCSYCCHQQAGQQQQQRRATSSAWRLPSTTLCKHPAWDSWLSACSCCIASGMGLTGHGTRVQLQAWS